jgi:hypothetical protein
VLLNDLDLSASYMERLVDETLSGGLAEQWFLDTEIPIVQRELKKLVDLGNRMRSVSKVDFRTGDLMTRSQILT